MRFLNIFRKKSFDWTIFFFPSMLWPLKSPPKIFSKLSNKCTVKLFLVFSKGHFWAEELFLTKFYQKCSNIFLLELCVCVCVCFSFYMVIVLTTWTISFYLNHLWTKIKFCNWSCQCGILRGLNQVMIELVNKTFEKSLACIWNVGGTGKSFHPANASVFEQQP